MLTTPKIPRVLCYGDSNTWGQRPDAPARYTVDERWTSLLQRALGKSADIIEEGLSGRTANLDYAHRPGRNGKSYLLPCLQSQNPLDIVVLMLGTNDIKIEFNQKASQIAAAINDLINDIATYGRTESGEAPQVILVSPAPINPDNDGFKELHYQHYFNEQSVVVSHELADVLQKVATDTGSGFFDAGRVAIVGGDGVHLDKPSHTALAQALTPMIREYIHAKK